MVSCPAKSIVIIHFSINGLKGLLISLNEFKPVIVVQLLQYNEHYEENTSEHYASKCFIPLISQKYSVNHVLITSLNNFPGVNLDLTFGFKLPVAHAEQLFHI